MDPSSFLDEWLLTTTTWATFDIDFRSSGFGVHSLLLAPNIGQYFWLLIYLNAHAGRSAG